MDKKFKLTDGLITIFIVSIFLLISPNFEKSFFFPLIFEIFCFLVPPVSIIAYKKGFKEVFCNFLPNKQNLPKIFFSWLIAAVTGLAAEGILSNFFDFSEITNQYNERILAYPFYLQILFFAVVPAVSEETLFRGFLLKCFESLGKSANFLIVSTLFTIFHQSLKLFFPILLLSFALTLIGFQRGGFFCAVILHLFYNLFSLILLNFPYVNLPFTFDIIIFVITFPIFICFLFKGLRYGF